MTSSKHALATLLAVARGGHRDERRPSVVIEVTRAKPEFKLADLADPAVEKVLRAATKSPF